MKHKAGLVSIVGHSNTGKSTLLNALIGEKISIVTKKIQTTRHRIFGIYNEDNFQFIFSDTPGFLKPHYKLQKKMMNLVKEAFDDSDVILFIIEINDFYKNNEEILSQLIQLNIPVIILINKIDLSNPLELEKNFNHWYDKFPNILIFPISALKKVNLIFIIEKLKKIIPESPPYFDKEQITNKPKRFFVNETIREKILLNYDKEIPYSVEVVTDLFSETKTHIMINSIIYVERESQKRIIIGHKGSSLSRIGKISRLEMKKIFRKPIVLHLYIKVKKKWRQNDKDLTRFGYSL